MKTRIIFILGFILFFCFSNLEIDETCAASSDRLPSVVNLSDKPEGVIFINRPAEATVFKALSVADINKDGYDDIVIKGITTNNESSTGNFPMIYVIYGGPNFPYSEINFDDPHLNSVSIKIQDARLKFNFLITRDVNGDKLTDFIFPGLIIDFFSIYVILGRTAWESKTSLEMRTTGFLQMSAGGDFGWGSTSYNGVLSKDMNEDGIDDIIFISSQPFYDPNWHDIIPRTRNIVYIVYGNNNLPQNINAENTPIPVTKMQEDSLFEISAGNQMAVGDFDHDNKQDMIINSDISSSFLSSEPDSSLYYGRIFLIYGSLFLKTEYTQSPLYLGETVPEIAILRTNQMEYHGKHSIPNELFACDIDGDGYDDPIIGYYRITENNKIYSKINILNGDNNLFQSSNIDLMNTDITRIYADSGYGSLFSSGDVNGDGYTDLLIGNIYNKSFYVLYGGGLPDSINIYNNNVFTTLINGAYLARCSGDINNDGYDDIVCTGDAGIYIIWGRGQTYQLENQIVKILPINKDSHFKFKFADGTGFNFHFTGSSLSTSPLLRLTNFGSHLPDNLNSIPTGAKAVSFIQAKITNMSDTCIMNCSFEYDKQAVHSLGIKEENLSVSYWDENLLKWQKQTSSVDTLLNCVNFETNHFSLWALVDVNDPVLSVDDQNSESPLTFRLEQSYPNPFNPVTTIKYQLP